MNKKWALIIVSLLVLIGAFLGVFFGYFYSSTNPLDNVKVIPLDSEWQLFRNLDHNYEIKFPVGWEPHPNGKLSNPDAYVLSHVTWRGKTFNNEDLTTSDGSVVIYQPHATPSSLLEYVKADSQYWKDNNVSYKIKELPFLIFNDVGVERVLTGYNETWGNRVYTKVNNNIYEFYFSNLGVINNSEEFKTLRDEMLKSFVVPEQSSRILLDFYPKSSRICGVAESSRFKNSLIASMYLTCSKLIQTNSR